MMTPDFKTKQKLQHQLNMAAGLDSACRGIIVVSFENGQVLTKKPCTP